ncbi:MULTISPECIES: peptidoglycan D,D-transpeptidase FtsI family protein [Gulbenkiania]|uniref:Peptidoglycan D,D-transpeptidase FtsI n=2 Tax=Gulbenkiania TaxID=397456 RepID=A0A0K6GY58_9NEIS|nr:MULTISPECIES: penicillin-binding transpeptidase domain-containing protein [Gulbenkiania]TCW32843.1 cell division protein FtsI (penicillin-binding protein 3) [Gulbenkiania mobilis]CUA83554.1 Cell division protein FtsI/penicillin-binding protein 2 [Gulbenkiania indica]
MRAYSLNQRTPPASPALRMTPGRVKCVLLVLGVLFLALIGRAVYLQVVQQDFLLNQGEARFRRALVLEANRGVITDRNGEPLALSSPVQTIWASPADMEPVPPAKLRELARLLEMSPADIAAKLSDRKREFVYLKRQISPELAERVVGLGIPGIAKQQEYRRFYPAGEVTAHLIGFTGVDGKGQEGVELAREKMLAGKNGRRVVLKDRRGHIIEDVAAIESPKNGQTLTLSIDHRIQYLAYRELKAAVEENKAKAGSVIVLDGRSGEVLAMANVPSYNPNNRKELDLERRRNRAVIDQFEPGSTMKPFPVAMAIEARKVTPHTWMDTRPYMIGPATVRDTHSQPSMDVTTIIQKSSNVGASKMALMFPPETMWQFYDAVGFGRGPQSGFPGEASGRLRNWKSWRPIEQATMSFGYGVSVSLLQLARAYTIFTDDGQLLPVSFTRLNGAMPGKQLIRPETARQMREMMMTVTQAGGTATRAQVLGFNVAGKSGTARKLVNGSYAANKHVGLFVGLAPATRPRLIVAVMVDEPTGGSYYGGTVAGPAFANIMAGSLRILGVEPDAPSNNTLLPVSDMPEVREET